MKTLEQVQLGKLTFTVAPQTMTIMEIAAKEGWSNVRLFGKGPMIKETISLNGWEFTPAKNFKKNIPQEAFERVATLKRNRQIIYPKVVGFLVADDLRHNEVKKPVVDLQKVAEPIKNVDWKGKWEQATEPVRKVDWKGKWDQTTEPVRKVDWAQVGKTTGKVALYGLGAVGAVAGAAVVLATAMVALAPIAIFGALAYDPILIAVVEDPQTGNDKEKYLWVALYEWWD